MQAGDDSYLLIRASMGLGRIAAVWLIVKMTLKTARALCAWLILLPRLRRPPGQ
jgi:hypothetical protein